MRVLLKVLFVLYLSVFLIVGSVCFSDAQEGKIRAKIGIQIKTGDLIKRAKSQDRLKEGDLLRIYIQPEKTGYVYVVHTDLKKAALLNMVQQDVQSSALVMPSLQEFYQIDGKSPQETFTIIIGAGEPPEAINIFKAGEVPYARWAELEKVLLKKSKIDLSGKTEKPFPISGNVRSATGVGDVDPFVSKLQIYSGKSILVKRYEFRIKK
ncbi:MAG: hypothetical protein JRI54_06015 [Deltaproteobacteria bacterium]|nr:hypothetical protein [Deltaproteobacteria bacterium]